MSSQAIGSLFISLGLDSAAFVEGVKVTQTRAQAFAASLRKKLNVIGDAPGIARLQAGLASVSAGLGVAAAAAAGAATVAMGGLSVAAMNSAKEIQNLSVLSNATPEEFQKIAYAASQVGISQEKMGDILKDVNDRVGDFMATGGGPMKDFFERIAPKVGVTAQQFRKLSGPQALQLYVDSLSKANVNQQDFTFFMEAMASDSTALLPILRGGGKAAQDYGARLEALGGVMDNSTVASLSKMKRSMDEVWVVIKGMGMALGAAFAPAVDAVAQAFVAAGMKGGVLRAVFDAVASVAGGVAKTIGNVVFLVSSLANGIWSAISAGAGWLANLAGIQGSLGSILSYTPIGWLNWMADLVKQTGGWGNALSLLGDVAVGVWQGMVESAKAIPAGLNSVWETVKAGFYSVVQSLSKIWADFLHTLADGIKGTDQLSDHYLTLKNKAIEAGAGVYSFGARAAAAQERAAALANTARDAVALGFDQARAALAQLNLTTEEANVTLETFGGGGLAAAKDGAGKSKEKLSDLAKVMKALREEAELLQATFGMTQLQADIWEKQRAAGVQAESLQGRQIAASMKHIDQMKKLKSATEEWRDSVSSAFASFIVKGGSFKKVLSDIIGKFAEMLAQRAFTKLFDGPLGGKEGGFFGGVMKLFGFANGTNFAPGGLARVNERGGEIMNLPRGTQVIPHDISKRMADNASKSPSVIFNIDARGATEGTADLIARKINEAVPGIVSRSVAAAKGARERGY